MSTHPAGRRRAASVDELLWEGELAQPTQPPDRHHRIGGALLAAAKLLVAVAALALIVISVLAVGWTIGWGLA